LTVLFISVAAIIFREVKRLEASNRWLYKDPSITMGRAVAASIVVTAFLIASGYRWLVVILLMTVLVAFAVCWAIVIFLVIGGLMFGKRKLRGERPCDRSDLTGESS